VPPLRQRIEDIPLLVGDILLRYGKSMDSLTPAMLEAVGGYAWPGNIRELLSFFESYLILLGDEEVNEELFLEVFNDRAMLTGHELGGAGEFAVPGGSMKEQLRHFRREIIRTTLKQCLMNKQLAAKRLDISYNTLWRIVSGKEAEE
jgi:propionate catabolism operon transcriptional regulator